MNINDDDVKALESRLRQSGWTDKASPERMSTKKRRPVAPPPTRFGALDGAVTATARRLARDFNGFSWPMYSQIATAFGLSFDDAVRALTEAKRLAGDEA